jgi:hypothetical protein
MAGVHGNDQELGRLGGNRPPYRGRSLPGCPFCAFAQKRPCAARRATRASVTHSAQIPILGVTARVTVALTLSAGHPPFSSCRGSELLAGQWMAALSAFLPARENPAEAWMHEPFALPSEADLRHAIDVRDLLDMLSASSAAFCPKTPERECAWKRSAASSRLWSCLSGELSLEAFCMPCTAVSSEVVWLGLLPAGQSVTAV